MTLRVAMHRGWLLLLLLAPNLAFAHTRSQSFSTFDVRGDEVRAVFTMNAIEVTRLVPPAAAGGDAEAAPAPDLGALLREHLASRWTVSRGGLPCPAATPARALSAGHGMLRVEQRHRCTATGPLVLQNDAFFDLAPLHIHTARVKIDDRPAFELLFTASHRTHSVAGDALDSNPGTSFGRWLRLGIEHIAAGADHVAFVIALLLLCRRLRDVAWLVTGFTIGHSTTLALAVLGVVRPNMPVVESLVGFTIALVAIETVAIRSGGSRIRPAAIIAFALGGLALVRGVFGVGLPVATSLGLAAFVLGWLPLATSTDQALRLRPLVSSLFGLIHGFGFASTLMDAALPASHLARALVGFNVGVEIGQVLVIAAIRGSVASLARLFPGEQARATALELVSVVLCALGSFWFLGRAFGV